MEFEQVNLNFEGPVAVLKFNHPEVMNAVSMEMLGGLREALDAVEDPDNGARCLVLTGEGRAFCAGANLQGRGNKQSNRRDPGSALETGYHPILRRLRNLTMPLVTAVNGAAAGVGMSFALMGDMVLAARSSYFLQAFRRIGLVPDGGSTWILPRLVGRARAMELSLMGERLPAEMALEWGLINRVYDDAALMDEAMKLARDLASGPTVALGLIRRLYWQTPRIPTNSSSIWSDSHRRSPAPARMRERAPRRSSKSARRSSRGGRRQSRRRRRISRAAERLPPARTNEVLAHAGRTLWTLRSVTRETPINSPIGTAPAASAGWSARPRRNVMLKPVADALLDRAQPKAGEWVLDVGCGCGATTMAFAAKVGPKGRAVGLDISAPMVARARELAPAEAPVEFVLADATIHPFEAAKFDLLASRFGVMFFAEPAVSFANMRKALRGGARVAFACWCEPRDNPWIMTPLQAVYKHVPRLPRPAPRSLGRSRSRRRSASTASSARRASSMSAWRRTRSSSTLRPAVVSRPVSRRRSASVLRRGCCRISRLRCGPPSRSRSARR